MEILAVIFGAIGVVLFIGTIVMGAEDGFNNMKLEDVKYGLGIGLVFIILSYLIG